MLSEPPDADPHVRWCGGRRGEPGAYPIALSLCPVPAVLDMWSSVLLCSRPEPRLLAFNVGHVLSALNRAAAR